MFFVTLSQKVARNSRSVTHSALFPSGSECGCGPLKSRVNLPRVSARSCCAACLSYGPTRNGTGPIAPRLQGRELTASRGTNETRPDGGAVSPRIPRRRPTYLPDRQSKTKSGGPSTRLGDRPSRWFLGDAVSPSSRAASLPLAGHPASFGLSLLRAHQGIARRGTAFFGARIPEGPPPRGRRVETLVAPFGGRSGNRKSPLYRGTAGAVLYSQG